MAIGTLISNMLPGAQGIAKAASLARRGAKAAAKAALKAAAKRHIKKMLRKFRRKLKKHMKKKLKQLRDDVIDEILEDGGEAMVTAAVSQDGGDAAQVAGDLAQEALVAADPTGIADVISSFSAEGCGEQRLTSMPMHGLVNSAPFSPCGGGCPHKMPYRYPNNNRCFEKKWGGIGCNVDPKNDPHHHQRNDVQCDCAVGGA